MRNSSKYGIEQLYKNPKSTENTPKNAKKQQSTETKRIVNTKIRARHGPPIFTFSLVGARFRTPATRQLCRWSGAFQT